MTDPKPDEPPTLNDFSEESRKPIVHKDEIVQCKVPGKGDIFVGYRGPIPARKAYGFVQFVDSKEHFHRNEAGYALSERVLRKIRSLGCRIILFAEDDTGIVYEFHESQFDERVAKKNNPMHDEDPQRAVEILQNRGKFHDHTPHVLMGDRGAN
jgi:hypothetical protein